MDSGSSPQADSAGSGHFFPLRRIRQAHRRRIRQAHRRRIRQAHRRRIRQAHRRQAQDTFLPFGGFGRLTAGGFGRLTAGGFGRLTAGRLRTLFCPSADSAGSPQASSGHQISPEAIQKLFGPFGGFGKLTTSRLRTPNFAGGDTKTFRALRQAQDTKFRRRRNLVEAAGVEPASENIPLGRLHTYPEI